MEKKTMYAIYSSSNIIETSSDGITPDDEYLSGSAAGGEGYCFEEEVFSTLQAAKERLFANYYNKIKPSYRKGNLRYEFTGYWIESQIFIRENADDDWEITDSFSPYGCGDIVYDLPTHFEIWDRETAKTLYETDKARDAFWEYSRLKESPEYAEASLELFANGKILLD